MFVYEFSGKKFAILKINETGETLNLLLRPDNSATGCYSVVMKNKAGRSSSDRMMYKGGMLIDEVKREYQEYLNIDNEGQFAVI